MAPPRRPTDQQAGLKTSEGGGDAVDGHSMTAGIAPGEKPASSLLPASSYASSFNARPSLGVAEAVPDTAVAPKAKPGSVHYQSRAPPRMSPKIAMHSRAPLLSTNVRRICVGGEGPSLVNGGQGGVTSARCDDCALWCALCGRVSCVCVWRRDTFRFSLGERRAVRRGRGNYLRRGPSDIYRAREARPPRGLFRP